MNSSYDVWIVQPFFPNKSSGTEVDLIYKECNDVGLKTLKIRINEINIYSDSKTEIYYNNKLITPPKIVLLRECANLNIYAHLFKPLELSGTKIINSLKSTILSHNKLRAGQILFHNNINTPAILSLNQNSNNLIELIEQKIGFPCVLKLSEVGWGKGVILCNDKIQFNQIYNYSSMVSPNQTNNIFVQKFIQQSSGKDLRVNVVGNKVLGCMKRISTSDDFRVWNEFGCTREPFTVTSEIEKLCLNVNKILGLNMSGIDLLFDDNNGFSVCEVNPTFSFVNFNSCINIAVEKEIASYIMNEIQNL